MRSSFRFGNKFYEEINKEPINRIKRLIKDRDITYFMVTTAPYQYTVTKLGSLRYWIEKETGYKTIKEVIRSPEKVVDYFKEKNEPINRIDQLQSRQTRRGSESIYQRPHFMNKSRVVEDIPGQRPKQVYIPKEDAVCPICLEDFDTRRLICKPLTCEHIFHCRCMSKIRRNRQGEILCPLCRQDTYGTSETLQYVTNQFGKSAASKHQSAFGKRIKRVKNQNKKILKDIKILKNMKFI